MTVLCGSLAATGGVRAEGGSSAAAGAEAVAKRYPEAKRARSEQEVLDDPQVKLVVSAGIPDERGPLGVRVMKHGKDYMVDKPGMTTLEQLAEVRRVQEETGRIYSILYSE